MVRSICLNNIVDFIKEKKLKPMKTWSDRYRIGKNHVKSAYLQEIIKKVRLLLNLVSGNNVVEMMKGKLINP